MGPGKGWECVCVCVCARVCLFPSPLPFFFKRLTKIQIVSAKNLRGAGEAASKRAPYIASIQESWTIHAIVQLGPRVLDLGGGSVRFPDSLTNKQENGIPPPKVLGPL